MSVFELDEVSTYDSHQSKVHVLHSYYDAEQASFEEVGGTCPNKDNPEVRCLTVRSVTIGLVCVIGLSFLQLWAFVSPSSPWVPPVLVILVTHLIGKVWSWIPWQKINGGPWTIKENTIIIIMTNVTWTFLRVYMFSTLTFVQWEEEQPSIKFVYMFFVVIAIQFLGFGLAGILRRFLVWPSGQVWPINLPLIALLRTLHEKQKDIKEQTYGAQIKPTVWQRFRSNRLMFFLIIMFVQFVYSWFPRFIMPVLRSFSWMCMIKPTNHLLSLVTGYYGMSIGSLSFGWYTVTWYLGSPIIVPRWAVLNLAVGFVLIAWIITPIVYFQDVWGTRSNPFAALTESTSNWSAMGLVGTAAALASLSAVFVHMILHHGKECWEQLRNRSLDKKGNDVHCRLIAIYPDVPDWWFIIVSLLALVVLMVVGNVSNMLAWYDVLFALVIPFLFVLPFGMVLSITGHIIHNPGVYYLTVLIATSIWPGDKSRTLAFVTVSYTTYCQTLQLVADMKLGHYMKIAPRTLFSAQAVACLVCASVSMGIQYYYYIKQGYYDNPTAVPFVSLYDYTNIGSAIANNTSFFTSSTMRNRNLLWSLLIGGVLPVPFWLASKQWKWCRLVHFPLMLSFVSWMPLEWTGTLLTWLLLGIIATVFFNKLYLKRYVYLTSAALDAGLFLAIVMISGPLKHYNIKFPSWWGLGGVTGDGCPLSLQTASGYQYEPYKNRL